MEAELNPCWGPRSVRTNHPALAAFAAVIVTIIFHEFGHGIAAAYRGFSGIRIGAEIGEPYFIDNFHVSENYSNRTNPLLDKGIISLSGPVANLLQGIFSLGGAVRMGHFDLQAPSNLPLFWLMLKCWCQ